MSFPSPGGSGWPSAMSFINETLANKELNICVQVLFSTTLLAEPLLIPLSCTQD